MTTQPPTDDATVPTIFPERVPDNHDSLAQPEPEPEEETDGEEG